MHYFIFTVGITTCEVILYISFMTMIYNFLSYPIFAFELNCLVHVLFFSSAALDFYGALRSRTYDQSILKVFICM